MRPCCRTPIGKRRVDRQAEKPPRCCPGQAMSARQVVGLAAAVRRQLELERCRHSVSGRRGRTAATIPRGDREVRVTAGDDGNGERAVGLWRHREGYLSAWDE